MNMAMSKHGNEFARKEFRLKCMLGCRGQEKTDLFSFS